MFKRFRKEKPAPEPEPQPTAASPSDSIEIVSFPNSQSASRTPSHLVPDSLDFIRQGDVRSRASKRFQSYRLIGEYEQPWLKNKKMGRTRINNFIIYGWFLVGAGLAGYICYTKVASVTKHDYCLIMDETFSGTQINPENWIHEVQVGGYGTGTFDWTTDDPTNSYISADGLHIQPTLTNLTTNITSELIMSGYTLNLTEAGTCTSNEDYKCAVISNSSTGSIIPPVRSARLTTKGKKSIRYGKVEIVAKLPKGDWLWPAIWMMPEDDAYGAWPISGEIDIAEGRGNDYNYPSGGRDTITSTIHWGPSTSQDAYWRATAGEALRRSDYNQDYHTFGLEWSKTYLFTYMDFQLKQVLYWSFPDNDGAWDMWQRGYFSTQTANGSLITNPWSSSPNRNAPFDQPFYLILNVAVGSQNGWFPDAVAKKPWVDSGVTAARDFWKASSDWLPTWGGGPTGSSASASMNVKSVKMWQEGKCGSPSPG